jgi:HD-like signal output (HDOD) protein
LSAAALKVANSPLYRVGRPITSIQQAVTFLGLKRVAAIVQIVSVQASVGKPAHLERFWETAANVATLCGLLSQHLVLGDRDETYTLGLFHDCGIPVLMQSCPDYVNVLKLAKIQDRSMAQVETEQYGFTHADAGAVLSRSWCLPEEMCVVIEKHHGQHDLMDGTAFTDEKSATYYALLKIAEHFSAEFRRMWGKFQLDEWELIGGGILAFLGLSETEFLDLQDSTLDSLEKRSLAD